MEPDDQVYNMNLPPGYRFTPTDEELIKFYLLRKILCKPPLPGFECTVIDENQFYNEPPQTVSDENLFKTEDCYFFCPFSKKLHDGGGRKLVRIVGKNEGYWKPNGTEESIYDEDDNVIGFKNSLVYCSGEPIPDIGRETPWVMEDYRVSEEHYERNIKSKDLWILKRIRWTFKANADDDDEEEDEAYDEEEEEEEEASGIQFESLVFNSMYCS